MSSGPEHYREAERLLASAGSANGQYGGFNESGIARAHVHALLAVAAAQALTSFSSGEVRTADANEWQAVTAPDNGS